MIYLLFLLTGACALVYEVVWSRQFGLLFGHTAQAAAVASYVGGALLQATIAGIAAFVILQILGVPAPLALAVIEELGVLALDLLPEGVVLAHKLLEVVGQHVEEGVDLALVEAPERRPELLLLDVQGRELHALDPTGGIGVRKIFG